MNFQKIVQLTLAFFAFAFVIGIIFWGMQWFSISLTEFFMMKTAQSQEAFLGSISNSLASVETSNSQRPSQVLQGTREPEKLEISATAALSFKTNLSGERIIYYAKNENSILPIASLTKLMTALVVLENYDLSKETIVSEKAVAQEGEQGLLEAGQTLSVRNLLYITLIESSNDAAYALAEIIGTDRFLSLMNTAAKNIGLKNTYFVDATGLDSGSYSSVSDLKILAEYLLKNYPLDWGVTSIKELDLYFSNGQLHHRLMNTNQLLGVIPGIVAGKTGWTTEAKGCFIVVRQNQQKDGFIINIVLGSDDRDYDMEKMINWVDDKTNL